MDELKTQKPRDGALILGDQAEQDDPSRHAGDGKAEEAAEILEELMNLMDLEVQIEIRSDAERIELDATGPDSGRVIGKKGATLDALQFLINKMVNRFPDARRHVVVDSGDYRERHDDGLVSLAKRQAQRAVTEGKVVTLQPMNARDRRVIHMSLAKFEGVSTMSQGEGTRRRIQIIPARRRR
ncbi:MAG: KH domain-containing protein [Myxococcota bacterium]